MAEPAFVPLQRCPRCLSPISSAAGGVCLRCLGEQVLQTEAGASGNLAETPSALTWPLASLEPEPARATEPARPPRHIANYELIEDIGRGGMGVVYAAHHPGLGRLVALKLIAGGALGSTERETRFIREAQAAARLRHPNIVRVFDVGRSGHWLYYAMDLLEGGDLRERAADARLDPRAAAHLLAEIADAVEHAHREGIIHRDLKPSNILLDAAGRGYVADFGLAHWELEPAHLTHTGQILGTPAFMAPEQAGGKATATTDVYGLGAILFHTLTGRAPFEGTDAIDVLARSAREPAPPPSAFAPDVPPALDAVCLRCLEKTPAARYPSAAALAADLRGWLASGQVETPYATAAEARQIVAEVCEHGWREGYQRHAIGPAIERLTRATQLAPNYATAHAELARLHAIMISAGWDSAPARREFAQQALARAQALEPRAPAVLLAEASCADTLEKNPDKAAKLLQAALELQHDDGPTLLAAGRKALHAGRWNTAEEWLVRATRATPPSGLPRQIAAYRACLIRDYGGAASWIDDAVRVNSEPVVRRMMQVWYHWLADPDPERAIAACRKFPADERKTRLIGGLESWFLVAARRFDEALAHYTASTDDDDRVASPQAALEVAELLRLQRLADSSEQRATEAQLRAMLDPTRVKASRSAHEAMSLAHALAVVGDGDAALRYAAEARKRCPWPENVIDGARLAGESPFLFTSGQLGLRAILGQADAFFSELAEWINVPAAVDVRCLAFDPTFDALRADPRWAAIMATAQMPIEVDETTSDESAPIAEAHRLVAEVRDQIRHSGYVPALCAGYAEKLSDALQLSPEFGDAHAEMAKLHMHLFVSNTDTTPARCDLARQSLERAESLDASSFETRLARVLYLLGIEGRLDEALPQLRALTQERPDDAMLHLRYARQCHNVGWWAEAKRALLRAAELEPTSPMPRHLLALTLFHLRDYADAALWMAEALRLDATPLARRVMAVWYRWLADPEPERALREFRALSDSDRKDRLVTWCESQILLTQRRYTEALAAYRAGAAAPNVNFIDQLDAGAYQLRLERWAGDVAAGATEAKLRARVSPARQRAVTSHQHALALAHAHAVLGNRAEAISLADQAVGMPALARDAIASARTRGANEFLLLPGRLVILAVLDERERFFAELGQLINVPAAIDARYLAMDPTFDPLRHDPRFERIMATVQIPIRS